jgi:hypothetical protein
MMMMVLMVRVVMMMAVTATTTTMLAVMVCVHWRTRRRGQTSRVLTSRFLCARESE